MGQQFDGLANATRLIDRTLLADRQMHRQMQERVGPALGLLAHAAQSGVDVGQFRVKLRVLGDPATRQRLDGIQRLPVARLGIDAAEESAHIGLGWLHQHGAILPAPAC
jgi:hypothetical protein